MRAIQVDTLRFVMVCNLEKTEVGFSMIVSTDIQTIVKIPQREILHVLYIKS